MSIRSIDLQVLIPRATEASKNQQTNDHQNSLQQQQQSEAWRQIAANRQHQVQNTPKSAGGKIEQEREKEKRREQDQKKESSDHHSGAQDSSKDTIADPALGHSIDIKT